MRYDYLIVGAGLFGAVFAREAMKAGKKCLVIDKRGHVAGNVFTRKVMGINVHEYGAHIFHTSDAEVWEYVNSFSKFNNFINSPIARYHSEVYNLPFNMNTFSRMWGIRTPGEAREIIDRQRAEAGIREAANLEEQALSLVGKDVYEKLIKEYTEKQWGRPCRELPAFIIKRVPLRFTYNNNYFSSRYQGIPEDGYTAMVERILGECPIVLGKSYEEFIGETEHEFDKIVYTGMIDEFFGYKFGKLEYRSLSFETEEMPGVSDYQGNAVVNYTSHEVKYTRIIEHKHFEFLESDDTVITREYPADWKPGDEPYYPMNDDKNNDIYEKYRRYAHENRTDVIFGGRLGQYKYYDMDQVIRSALDTAASEGLRK